MHFRRVTIIKEGKGEVFFCPASLLVFRLTPYLKEGVSLGINIAVCDDTGQIAVGQKNRFFTHVDQLPVNN